MIMIIKKSLPIQMCVFMECSRRCAVTNLKRRTEEIFTQKCQTQDVLQNKHVEDKEYVSDSVSVLYGTSPVQTS